MNQTRENNRGLKLANSVVIKNCAIIIIFFAIEKLLLASGKPFRKLSEKLL